MASPRGGPGQELPGGPGGWGEGGLDTVPGPHRGMDASDASSHLRDTDACFSLGMSVLPRRQLIK